MHARVVRFTDVSPERIAEIGRRVAEEGPPPGVPAVGMKLLYDEAQGSAVFVGFFATADDLRQASEVFDNMDATETPGTRASVDLCEVKVEAELG